MGWRSSCRNGSAGFRCTASPAWQSRGPSIARSTGSPGQAPTTDGKFRVASGLPTTPFIESGPNTGQLDFTRYNAGPRLPTFHSLDVRIDRRWSFRGWQLDLYLDVQNVYGRENVSQIVWNPRIGAPEPNESLGILPSIGVNIEF